MSADALRAIRLLGTEPVALATVGGWRSGRATYRVTLADGRVVKIRELSDRARVSRAAALTAAIGDGRLPAPLAVVGAVTVETWVPGSPLSARPVTDSDVEAAADLLGFLHSLVRVPAHRFHRNRSLTAVVARLDRQLADLTAAGVVSSRQGRRLLARVQAGLPARAERGVTHGDLRPENLVVAPSGDLVSVDNEAVAFDFLDHDLGRTWCRWPMSSAVWSQFFRRYARWGRPGPGADLESAWRCVAAVKGAHRWHRAVGATTDAPLVALSRVLDDL